MLYDRPYMRQSTGYRQHLPMYGWILIVIGVVFLLQNILQVFFGLDGLLRTSTGGIKLLPDWFALSETNLSDFKLWTLLTYGLFHGGLFHLLVNSLVIFFVGRMVEMRLGRELLLKLFLFAVLGGGILWSAVNWGRSGGQVIGASAGALGLLIYFCLRNPNEPITLLLFFVIPVTVLPKWIGWALLGIEGFGLVFVELAGRGGFSSGSSQAQIAYSAHVGGMAAAYLFFRYENWFRNLSLPRVRWGQSSRSKDEVKPRYRVNVSDSARKGASVSKSVGRKNNLREEVDRILDKINASGFGSLSEDEKETLNRAKEMLGK